MIHVLDAVSDSQSIAYSILLNSRGVIIYGWHFPPPIIFFVYGGQGTKRWVKKGGAIWLFSLLWVGAQFWESLAPNIFLKITPLALFLL